MSWPLCVTICVGIVSFCAMTTTVVWCGMNAIIGKDSDDKDDALDKLDEELDQQGKEAENKQEEPGE
jgi:hypothetical protein